MRGLFGGIGLQGGSGSLNKIAGGSTFQKNNVIRRRVVPVQPNTGKQSLQKGIFSAIQAAWLGLTLVEQAAWNTAASSGDWKTKDPVTGTSRNPASGRALFIELNGNIAVALGNVTTGIITTVPSPVEGGSTSFLTFNVTSDAGDSGVSATYSGALGTNEVHVFYMSPMLSTGVSRYRANTVRYITENNTASAGLAAALSAAYSGEVPDAVVGARVCYRIRAINTLTGQSREVASGVVEVVEA